MRNTDTSTPAERFFVADRDVGWLTGSASLTATQVSAGTFVGAVGIHYAVGVSFAVVWLGIWAGWLFSVLYVAPQLREFGGVTVPEFIAARFDGDGANGDRSRAVAALLVAAIYLVFTSAQYVAAGVVLDTALGIPPAYGMSLTAAIALVYTAAGGMRASLVTDVLLVLLMLGGLLVATAIGLGDVGGVEGLRATVAATSPSLLRFSLPVSDTVGFTLAFGLSVGVAPYEVSRIYALQDRRTVRRAIGGSIVLQACIAVCVVVLGLIARVKFPGLATPDAAVVELISSFLGPVSGTLLLVGILASLLSTVDSVLLVSSSAIAYDCYECILLPSGEEANSITRPSTLQVARTATILSGVIPLLFAFESGLFGELVQLIVALYATLIAGALFFPVVLGIHWEGATTAGALAGMLSGATAALLWHLGGTTGATLPASLLSVPPVVIALAVSAVGVLLGSVLSPSQRT